MPPIETGLLNGRVPFLRGGSGPCHAVVFFGVNALFKRLDQIPNLLRYAHQVARLLPGHRITILGYAASTFDEIVRDAAAAIATAPDVVLGISLGGFVAMRFAATHPQLVPRLVLLVSAHRFSPAGSHRMERQIAALEREDLPALIRENALLFRRPWYNWLLRCKLWKEGNRIAAGFRDPAAILETYRQLFGPEFANNAAYAQRITCPTLLIGGNADQFFDRLAIEETAALILNAQLRLFENETHMLPIERSAEVAAAIKAFVSRSA